MAQPDPGIQLSEAFFQKAAGWEAVQHARMLLSTGKVLSSNWTPPILKGVVQAGETSYRAGLVIKSDLDIDNLCTCRQAREFGTICPHSVAVGLHWLKPPAPVGTPTKAPVSPASPASSPAPIPPRTAPRKDAVRLRRDPHGASLTVHVVLPPNFQDTVLRGKAMLVFEGVVGKDRAPLDSFVRRGSFRISEEDAALLDAAELATGGDTPGMVQLPPRALAEVFVALGGFPRVTLGRNQSFRIEREPALLPMRATLAADGTIAISVQPQARPPVIVPIDSTLWILNPGNAPSLAPLAATGPFREALQRPVTIARAQVPTFLSQDWPRLEASGKVEANFKLTDFELTPQAPRFHLDLTGGLAQLSATLQCAYGQRIMTVGVTRADEATWLPDPQNPRRYGTRDLGAEHAAFNRLRQAGFSGPDSQGRWQLVGQDRVLAYFSRLHPRLEREWTVNLEERLDRSAQATFERVSPQLRITSSGEQWFNLEVSYTSGGGSPIPAAEIQQLLRGGSRRLRSGKLALIDTGAVEELQEILVDCAPEQAGGSAETTRYRMGNAQAGFLEAGLRDAGLVVQAPTPWRQQARATSGEVQLNCPALGLLEPILRPYQKQGVAWLRFLRDQQFGGVLADEMGLGKTLQVLTHLTVARSEIPVAARKPWLVVCPTSLVFNWAAEAARFIPDLKVLRLHGADRHRLFGQIPQADLVITSYALVRRDLDALRQHSFDTVVLDEAQHIKNRTTQNAQAVKNLRSSHRLVLTGTPLENSVLDLWSIFDFLMPGYLGNADDFRERYELPIARERDTATMARLARRVRPFLLRRLKRDVAADLPPRLEQVSYCELTEQQASVYEQLLSATRKEVEQAVGAQGLAKSRMLVLTALLRLRQACCDLRLLKLPATASEDDPVDASGNETNSPLKSAEPAPEGTSGKFQMFGELLDEVIDGGHRALVFSQFTSMLRLLREELERRGLSYCYLDGTTRDRAAVVERFQKESSIPVFLISLKAGGVGLNLTGADTVIHFDPWWNPAVEDQATDRAHRIGQSRVVTAYKLITRGTVEEKILALQQRKRDLIAATLTGEDVFTNSLGWDEIQELLG
jgi:superfamily II DNA or RNA helicase